MLKHVEMDSRQRLADQFSDPLNIPRCDRCGLEASVGPRINNIEQVERFLQFALQAAHLGSWSLDLCTNRLALTNGSKTNFGHSTADTITYDDINAAVHPEDGARRDEALRMAVEVTGEYQTEFRILTPAGEERWLGARGQVLRRSDGTPLLLVGVSQDITDRKRAEEHRTLLANELSHRVKNMLATLQAIVSQTLRSAGSLEEAGETLSGRIKSMGAATDMLINEQRESASMHELVDRALAPFRSDADDRFRVNGPSIPIPPRIAVGLALALHELSTNAAKYGALSTPGGRVDLSWKVAEESKASRLYVCWEEVGGPPVVPPTRTGFGSKLIERVLASEINGTVELDYRPSGVVFTAIAPMPDPNLVSTDMPDGCATPEIHRSSRLATSAYHSG
jgi:PAS domain S-box-containing protein